MTENARIDSSKYIEITRSNGEKKDFGCIVVMSDLFPSKNIGDIVSYLDITNRVNELFGRDTSIEWTSLGWHWLEDPDKILQNDFEKAKANDKAKDRKEVSTMKEPKEYCYTVKELLEEIERSMELIQNRSDFSALQITVENIKAAKKEIAELICEIDTLTQDARMLAIALSRLMYINDMDGRLGILLYNIKAFAKYYERSSFNVELNTKPYSRDDDTL